MKNLLTEKNLMWAAIVALAILQLCPASLCGAEREGRSESMRQRMGQMRDRIGSYGDTGRGEWVGPRADRKAKGDRKKPKTSE